jgi:signal transduction histidine kinase
VDRVPSTKTNTVDGYGRFSRNLTPDSDAIEQLFSADSGQRTSEQQTGYDLRQARRQLEQISVAAQVFSLQLDYQHLLAEIASHAYEILRADRIIIYSNVDNQLQVEAQSPNIRARQTEVSEDASWCVRFLKAKVTNEPSGDEIRNSLCVPLLSTQNRVLAVIEARNKRTGGHFTDQDVRVATCLARVAASAVDRARLFFRIEEWRQSIETLLSFNATVNQQLEPAEMVRELVANVTGFLDADGGAAGIVIHTDQGIFAECESFWFDGQWHPYRRRWKPNEGIPGIVLETEFPLLINDYQSNLLVDPVLRRFDIGSCICVPIKNSQEEVLGFFKLHRHLGEPEFTWQDAAFLETLGNTAAVAIENARLVKSLELKNEQIKNLSQGHLRRLEEERRHIARELHDETGQMLIGLKLRLQVLAGLLNDEQRDAKQELAALRIQVNAAASQLKDLAKRLRPPTLDELGFEASLRQLVAEFRQQAEFSIRVDFQSRPDLPSEAETALFRIAQESLTNVTKHAGATCVEIVFQKQNEQQVFSIRDDGAGFDPRRSTTGLGLIGIKERVKMLDGTVEVRSSIGKGTELEITLPGQPAQRKETGING